MTKKAVRISCYLSLAAIFISACASHKASLEAKIQTAIANTEQPSVKTPSSEKQDITPSPSQTPTKPTSTEIFTITPKPSDTLTQIPESTPPLTSEEYYVADCIDPAIWRFWPSEIEAPVDPERTDCYALDRWGFNIIKPSKESATSSPILAINRYWLDTTGIYFTIPTNASIRIVLAIKVIEIGPDIVCPQGYICDSNLIFGVGNPEELTGAFIMYRAFNVLSGVRLCILSGIKEPCAGINRVLAEYGPYEDIPQHIVDFQIEPDRSKKGNLLISLTVDGVTSQEIVRSIDPNSRIFWIGYNFRQPGHLNAVVEFK
jgi:hypothetical protein